MVVLALTLTVLVRFNTAVDHDSPATAPIPFVVVQTAAAPQEVLPVLQFPFINLTDDELSRARSLSAWIERQPCPKRFSANKVPTVLFVHVSKVTMAVTERNTSAGDTLTPLLTVATGGRINCGFVAASR